MAYIYSPMRAYAPRISAAATAPVGLGTAPGSTTVPANLVRAALLIAAGAVAWKLYAAWRDRPLERNLPPWPAIGPLFNSSAAIGSKFALTPFIV